MKGGAILPTLILLTVGACGGSEPINEWIPTFADEFDGPAGPPDVSKWTPEVNGRGGGNQELQFYSDRPDNLRVNGMGQLSITARREAFEARDFTSARINTQGKFEQQNGRFEARMKLPKGKGYWPAFWMLGGNFDDIGWPKCGEIDVMENRGAIPSTVLSSLHGPGYQGGNAITELFRLNEGTFADEFHVFSVEWEAERIRFSVDGTSYHTVERAGMRSGATWVFDHPFFMILNLAVGGTFGGEPNADTVFPQELLVDWVRAYRRR